VQQLLVWQQGKVSVDCSLQTLHTALQDQQALTWLDLQVEDDLSKYSDLLTNEFKLSRLVTDSLEDKVERSKLVEQHGYFYLVVHGLAFDIDSGETSTPKLDIVFGRNFLVTVHRSPMPWLDGLLTEARTDASQEHIMSRGVARLLHAVLDTLVDSYFPVLDELDDLVDELEDATVTVASNEVQGRIFRTKRSLAQMRRVISPQVEVMNSLITRTGDLIPTEAEPYFADVHDHLVRTFEVLDSYRDLMSGLLDVYLSTISNRLNEVMKQLAIIATIFLPITFITGVFGQNFAHSPQVEHDAGYNFWIVLGFMGLITIVQIWYFKYRKWM
jgi:magnesium transporter